MSDTPTDPDLEAQIAEIEEYETEADDAFDASDHLLEEQG